MRIITSESDEYSKLLQSLNNSIVIGTYTKEECLRTVSIKRHLIMIQLEEDPTKIAVHEAPSPFAAERLATQVLQKHQLQGAEVRFTANRENFDKF
jgi:hypothetical protein